MAWPKLECHFESVNQTPAKTEVSVAFFRVADGGIVDGQQQYSRTLLRRRIFTLDAGWDSGRIVPDMVGRVAALNTELGLGIAQGDFICSLSL